MWHAVFYKMHCKPCVKREHEVTASCPLNDYKFANDMEEKGKGEGDLEQMLPEIGSAGGKAEDNSLKPGPL